MSDHMDGTNGKNLASLVSVKSGARRDGPDTRTRSAALNATRNASFDGFLNTFLGRDASEKGSKRTGPGTSAGSGLRPSDKESLKKSMQKTVAGDEQAENGGAAADEGVAAAAEEAALLIWNLLYGYGEGAALPGSAPGSLRQLALLLGSKPVLASSQPGLGLDAVQGAIHTANASAEMNSAALLAGLDELLEGMPRHVLDDALGRMAGQMGLPPTCGFESVLAMLGGRVTGINTASGKELLGTLSASAASAVPAEIAGGADGGVSIERALEDFFAEKDAAGETSGTAEELADEFAAWLKKTGKAEAVRDGAADRNTLADALAKIANETGGKAFGAAEGKMSSSAEFLRALENALQSGSGGKQDGAARTPLADAAPDAPAGGASLAQPNAQLPGQTASVQSVHTASVSTMLEQMENIERLAEAMKLATKGGVNNITMQLAPAELGKVMLRVQSKNGVVSASLKVERAEAAEQLSGNLHHLKESLKALGIELGEVEIQHQPPAGAADLLADLGGGNRRGEENQKPGRRDQETRVSAQTESPAAASDEDTGALNIFI